MKLNENLRTQVLGRVAANETYESIVAWLRKAHRVEITKQAIGKLVAKHRSAPPLRAAPKRRKKSGGRKVSPTEAHFNRLSRLLKQLTRDAIVERSGVNVDKVAKASAAYQRAYENLRQELGLDQPTTETVADLAALLAKA